MASPINTGGFAVQERPRVDYFDPRMMVGQNVLPAVQQGLGLTTQFQQIADDAAARPIKRKLQQIQLEEAQARLAQLPIEHQLQALHLGEAQQQAAIPQQIVDGVEIVGGGRGPAEFDDIYTPRERVTRGRSVAAGGIISPFEKRETLLTAPQVEADAEKAALNAEATRALANQRNRGKEFEVQTLAGLIENAKAEGDDETAAIYEARLNKLNTVRPVLSSQDIYDRNIAKAASDAGITFEAAKRLADTPAGAAVLARAAAANKSAVTSAIVPIKLSAADRALIASATSEPVVRSAAPVAVPLIAEPKTEAEYKALPSGTQYVGPDGKTRVKK